MALASKVTKYFGILKKGRVQKTFDCYLRKVLQLGVLLAGDGDKKIIDCLLATLPKTFPSPGTSLQGKDWADGCHEQTNSRLC